MEDKPVKQDLPHSMFDGGQHKAPKRDVAVDKEASPIDEDRALDSFNNFKYKISKIKSNYSSVVGEIQPDTNSSNRDAMKEQVVSDEEFWLLSNSLLMRKMLFLMGIKVFASKTDFEVDAYFKEAEYQIGYLIEMSESEFQCGKFESAEIYMKNADDIYTSVTTVKEKKTHKQMINNANTPNNTINKDSTKDKQTDNTDTTLKTYKITVIGDDVDLMRCYKIAETAILTKDLKKAERWLQKAERIKPTGIAKQLMKKLEQAKMETTEAATIPNEVIKSSNEAKEKSECDIVTSNEQKAEKCHKIAWKAIEDGDFEKAKRFIYKTQRICPEVDTKDIQIKLETCVLANKNEVFDPLIDKKDLVDHNIFYGRSTEVKKSTFPEPKYMESNSETAFDPLIDKEGIVDQNIFYGRSIEFKESTIPEPKYMDSNSETAFASNTDNKYCNRTANKDNMDEVNEYLKKGRMALARHNIEKAEYFARKAEELCSTVRGKGLIEDIDKTKRLNIGSQRVLYNRVSEDPHLSNTSTPTESLIKERNSCFSEALKEYKRRNYDKAEEVLSFGTKIYSSPATDHLLKFIKIARSQGPLSMDDTLIKDANEAQSGNSFNETSEIGLLKKHGKQSIINAKKEIQDGNFDGAINNLEDYKELHPNSAEKVNNYIQGIEHHFREIRREKAQEVNKFMQSIEHHIKCNEQCNYTDVNITEDTESLRKDKTDREGANMDNFGNYINTVRSCTETVFVTPQTHSVESQVKICINEAQKEFEAGNYDKSEEILTKVKVIYPAAEANANKILREIYRLRKESDDFNDTDKHKKTKNRNDAKGCTQLQNRTDANRDQQTHCNEIAKKAIAEGYLEKAEKLCHKAIRMDPNADVKIRNLITNIHEEKEKKKDEEKQAEKKNNEENRYKEDSRITEIPKNVKTEMEIDENLKLEVEKCYEKAELAYNEGHFDKAERLLKKTIRMAQPHPFEIAEALLFKLQNEKKKEKNRRVANEKNNEQEPTETKTDQDPPVQAFINKALEAIGKKYYYVANFWLQKVQTIEIEEKTKEEITTLINQIHSSVVDSLGGSQKDEVTEREEFKQSAENYLAVAKQKFSSQDYYGARHNVILSECFRESKEAKELCVQITKKEYEIQVERQESPGKSKNQKLKNKVVRYKRMAETKTDYTIFQADKYLENAEEALRFGDLEKAEKHVKKSLALNSSVKGKKMLIEIQEKLRFNRGICTRWYNKACEGFANLKKYL